MVAAAGRGASATSAQPRRPHPLGCGARVLRPPVFLRLPASCGCRAAARRPSIRAGLAWPGPGLRRRPGLARLVPTCSHPCCAWAPRGPHPCGPSGNVHLVSTPTPTPHILRSISWASCPRRGASAGPPLDPASPLLLPTHEEAGAESLRGRIASAFQAVATMATKTLRTTRAPRVGCANELRRRMDAAATMPRRCQGWHARAGAGATAAAV